MGDDLHAIIKTSIELDVDVLVKYIGERDKLFGILTNFTALIYLQLNTEVAVALAKELGVRLVVVIADKAIVAVAETSVAVGAVIVIIVVCVVLMNYPATVLA